MRNRVLTVAVLSVLLVSLAAPAFAADVSTFSFTFTSAGEYKYFCSLHPHMTGVIKVE